jgi:hypothetical protein
MTPVAVPPVLQGPKAPPAGSAAATQARVPLHTDFRSLLRGQALTREPLPAASPRAAPGHAARATAATSGDHRSTPQGAADDDAAELAPLAPEDDPFDPFARHRASLAPPDAIFDRPAPVVVPLQERPLAATPADTPVLRAAAGSLEELLPALVRRVAWSGDGRSGTVRLELGSGPLTGATLLVHADAGRVRVRLDLPAGVDAASWERRIRQRLEARRIATDGVEVA